MYSLTLPQLESKLNQVRLLQNSAHLTNTGIKERLEEVDLESIRPVITSLNLPCATELIEGLINNKVPAYGTGKLTKDDIDQILSKVYELFAKGIGNQEIFDQLVYGNLRLVLSVIQRFGGRGENADDLFQIGCIGLIKAIDNFNPNYNLQFSTYAVPMIIGEIKRFLRDDGLVKVSRAVKENATKIKLAIDFYFAKCYNFYEIMANITIIKLRFQECRVIVMNM